MLVVKDATISVGKGNDTRLVNIWIDKGLIAKIADKGEKIPNDAEIIDASKKLVIPGAIDPHVHFDTPGFEFREDFAHGSMAAAAGGVTTVVDMPCTSLPPITSAENLKNKLKVIKDMAYVDYALWGGVSHKSMIESDWMSDMNELWKMGVVGFKVYEISGMDTYPQLSTIELGQVMQHASSIGALVGLHAEEPTIIKEREALCKKENRNSIWDYYYSRSDPAEKDGVALGCQLAKQTKCRLHVVHVGSGKAVDIIAQYKMQDVDVTAETCPHFLAFNCDDFDAYGSIIKTAPVVKTKDDQERLWDAVEDEAIDFVSTDHAPCPVEDKKTGNAWTDYGGLPHVELLLPYMFSEGYKKGRLTLARLIELTSGAAAKRLELYPKKGALEVGSDADLVIIDPKAKRVVDASKMYSKGKFTPFDGAKFAGEICKTILRGEVVYDFKKGIVGKAGFGKWLKRD